MRAAADGTMEQLNEVIDFLGQNRLEVRHEAVKLLLSVSLDAQAVKLFEQRPTALEHLWELTDAPPLIAHDAFRLLINLSSWPAMTEALSTVKIVTGCCALATDPFSVLAELACMLLANLTRVGRSVGWILQPPPPVPSDAQGPGGFLPPLVRAFVAGRRFNNKTDYHFLGAVLANVSQHVDGRTVLTRDDAALLLSMLPFYQHPNVMRRGGVISVVKNCCFDTSLHAKLLSEEVGLLRTILMALAPATGLVDDDERDKVAPYLLELPAGHKVEPEAGLRVAMVDTLLLLGTKAASRQIMRSTGVYYVMRALHKQEENEAVRDSIEGVVNLMVRDDDPRDAAADGGDDEAITMV